MSLENTSASRAERPSEIGTAEGLVGTPRRAERQRGRWNFLTWSFFLAEVAAGAQFLGTGAKAQGDDAARSKAHGEATDAIQDGVLGNPGPAIAATDEGASGPADASAAQAPSPLAELNLLNLLQGEEPGAPLSNAGDIGFGGTSLGGGSSSGSGSSGTGSNGGPQADSGGPPPNSDDPPPEVLPPITGDLPSGGLPPITGDPPSGGLPPITGDPPFGGLPPITGDPPSGGLPPNLGGETVSLVLDVTLGNLTDVLDTTLDQLTGLPLVDTVGGLLGNTVDGALGQITGLVGNPGELTAVVGGLLDSSLNAAFSATDSLVPQTVGSVAASVGALTSSVGDLGLLGDIGHLSADGTGNILNELPGGLTGALSTSGVTAPALNIVSDALEITPLAQDQAVSSGGTIAFPDLTSANALQVNELFAGGQYTDYGLAVQSEGNSGATTIVDPLGAADNSTLNSPVDSPIDSHEPALSPSVPDVNASSVSLPSIIEELGVRDLSI